MNVKQFNVVCRLLLSCVLLYFVYFETGPVTTAVLFLLMVNAELSAVLIKHMRKLIEIYKGD